MDEPLISVADNHVTHWESALRLCMPEKMAWDGGAAVSAFWRRRIGQGCERDPVRFKALD